MYTPDPRPSDLVKNELPDDDSAIEDRKSVV